MEGSANFSRNWQHYRQGFGSVEAEFWAGEASLKIFIYNNFLAKE